MKNNQGTWLKYTNFKWNETKIWIKDKFFYVIQIFLLSQSLLCHYYILVNMIITNVYLFCSATYYDLSMGWYFRPSYYSYDRFRQICGWRHTTRRVFIVFFCIIYQLIKMAILSKWRDGSAINRHVQLLTTYCNSSFGETWWCWCQQAPVLMYKWAYPYHTNIHN